MGSQEGRGPQTDKKNLSQSPFRGQFFLDNDIWHCSLSVLSFYSTDSHGRKLPNWSIQYLNSSSFRVLQNPSSVDGYTVKKAFRYSRPQPGCHLPNSPWAGIIYIDVIIPAQGEFGKRHPGWGQEYRKAFFTVCSTLHWKLHRSIPENFDCTLRGMSEN